MKIAILILLIYSLFGIHFTFEIGRFRNYIITFTSDKVVTFIALVLYCIYVF